MSLALDLAVLKALQAEVTRREALLKAAFKSGHGRGTAYAELDGQEVGQVTVTKGSISWGVRDEHAFTRWVRDNHPSELVESVSPAFRAKILSDAKAAGAPVTRDGEVVPGVEDSERAGYVAVKVTDEQAAVIVSAWRSGVLGMPDVPELGGAA